MQEVRLATVGGVIPQASYPPDHVLMVKVLKLSTKLVPNVF